MIQFCANFLGFEAAIEAADNGEDIATLRKDADYAVGLPEAYDTTVKSLNSENVQIKNRQDRDRHELTDMIRRRSNDAPAYHQPGLLPKLKLDLTTFCATPSDRPARFSHDLENYIKVSDCDMKMMRKAFRQALGGAAHDWWAYVEPSIESFDDF